MVDYSRFRGIGDSDSEASHAGLDVSESPPESPRVALQRRLQSQQEEEQQEPVAAPREEDVEVEPRPASSLERFLALAEGAEPERGDDAVELMAVARATLQSALASGEGEVPRSLLRALVTGLGKRAGFAKEQAPEFVADVLSAQVSGLVPTEECEQTLNLVVETCKPKELYTFLMEALCGGGLAGPAQVRGISLLRATFSRMDETRRHLFLGSCLPALLKKSLASTKVEELAPELAALHQFAVAFLPHKEDAWGVGPAKVARSMIAAFLLKAALKAYPTVVAVESLQLPEADSSTERFRPDHLRCAVMGDALAPLCAMSRDGIAASTRPLHELLEEMDLGDPTGDGGGDLEVSPLCLAVLVCLLELHGCWRELQPQALPVGLSAAKRVNLLMRSCFVLVSHQDPPVSVGEAASGPRWSLRGLALLAACVLPLVKVAHEQTPKAFEALSGPLCRWYPDRSVQAVLEALASTPDIERQVRGALFHAVGGVVRAFSWPCRFELYLSIMSRSRVDSIIGAVVTMFKDDWWASVNSDVSLGPERSRLIKVFKATLSGDVQVVDGMDTLTASLNIARLVLLAPAPLGPFMLEGLRKGGQGIDLEAMLATVSQQIDFELGLLNKAPASGGALADQLARTVEEALGQSEGGVNVREMKRDRITMVAHLVARVRELLATASATARAEGAPMEGVTET